MFSSSRLKPCIIICSEKNYFFKKKSIIRLKKEFENTIVKVVQVIFNPY